MRMNWRSFVMGLMKLIMLMAFYVAGYLSANRVAIDQEVQIEFLRSETVRQQSEIDKFKESKELVLMLEQQVDELSRAVGHLQMYHGTGK